MTLFLITLGFFLLVVAGMAVGYIFQQKSLAGSCGGLGSLGIDKACNCDNPCEKRQERERKAALAKDSIDIKII
ncbi:(Na+)-NQR maturation NqrM [Thalassotalea euphylliae]|uniref:(Na+)-NQR maturation NqrM n=1 Tax=Thalassotalea euphylliae TaxID=1655234 RepID=A0A3E0UBR9_9GAMM|nr:(Na+)-NQR maturation NqrM [Thalassotalea euphylliae]REL34461.1 (Na+)-NQR maturation NqrM [Thalassotalea euphylliae]